MRHEHRIRYTTKVILMISVVQTLKILVKAPVWGFTILLPQLPALVPDGKSHKMNTSVLGNTNQIGWLLPWMLGKLMNVFFKVAILVLPTKCRSVYCFWHTDLTIHHKHKQKYFQWQHLWCLSSTCRSQKAAGIYRTCTTKTKHSFGTASYIFATISKIEHTK